jgi:glycosyltransferase involved in cell wall biosynthesis
LFVLSSLYGESITKSVIEAMALGVAPVITAIPGNRELVIDSENGLVVPPGKPMAMCEAILKLYRNKPLCKKYGENSRNHIRNHLNLDQTILKTQNLYESLVSEKQVR